MLREKGQPKFTRIALAIIMSLMMVAITGNNSWATLKSISADVAGTAKSLFTQSESVYGAATLGLTPSTSYDLYVVEDVSSWVEGQAIPARVSGTETSFTTDGSGDMAAGTLIWSDLSAGSNGSAYDIVIDANGDGLYNSANDFIDYTMRAGFKVSGVPTIDGVFTGYTPGDPVHEYSNATSEPSIGPTPGLYGYFYQMNDATKLYVMNDFYIDTGNDNDPGGTGNIDYNVFKFDLDKNGTFEYEIYVYPDDGDSGTPQLQVELNDTCIPTTEFSAHGIEGAAGFGRSPKQQGEDHRMYEISINHSGINVPIAQDPDDPPYTPPPDPPERCDPPCPGPGCPVIFVQVWWGDVVPTNEGTPRTYAESTLIELSSFTADGYADGVTLKWVTESEIDNAGFNLWRSETEDGEYVQINDTMIPAEGDEITGYTYTYVDEDVEPGATYYYKLEDIDLYGLSTFHGPISVEWVCLEPVSPEDEAEIPWRMKQHPRFSWDKGICTAEAIEFSVDAEFTRSLSYPVRPGADKWRPWRRQWDRIRRPGRRGKPIYWRVVGLDATGGHISSQVFSFTLVREGRRTEAPKEGGLWGWLTGLVARISSALEYST